MTSPALQHFTAPATCTRCSPLVLDACCLAETGHPLVLAARLQSAAGCLGTLWRPKWAGSLGVGARVGGRSGIGPHPRSQPAPTRQQGHRGRGGAQPRLLLCLLHYYIDTLQQCAWHDLLATCMLQTHGFEVEVVQAQTAREDQLWREMAARLQPCAARLVTQTSSVKTTRRHSSTPFLATSHRTFCSICSAVHTLCRCRRIPQQ